MDRIEIEPAFETKLAGYDIRLFQKGVDVFVVQYGHQVDYDLTYNQACRHLGAAIMHATASEGFITRAEY